MSDVVVHHLEHSRSTRILWLLEELGVPYEMKTYARIEGARAPAVLRELHPLGKAPIVSIGNRTFAESGAILESLLDRYDESEQLRPARGTEALDEYRYWLHFAEGSMMSPLLVKLIFNRLRGAPMPFFVKPIAKGIADKVDQNYTNGELERLFGFVDHTLGTRPFFAGDQFTAADIQMAYGVIAGVERAQLASPTPNITAWRERVESRPAYAKAVKAGGPFAGAH